MRPNLCLCSNGQIAPYCPPSKGAAAAGNNKVNALDRAQGGKIEFHPRCVLE